MTAVLTEAPRRARSANRTSSAMVAHRRRIGLHTMQVLIVVSALAAWEFGARSGAISSFLFGSPSAVWEVLTRRAASGELWTDIGITTTEVVLGFLIGAVGGSALGLLLWYSRFVADLTSPFIAAIGSIPVLAVAPLTIIWFGTEMTSKVVIVAFSCVVVSLTTSYRGARRTDPDLINLMRSFGATRSQIFRKLVVPSAMSWVISGLKLNVGFALVGAIVGEYISSEAGVGNMILRGSSNFTITLVIAGIVIVMVMVLVFNLVVTAVERILGNWEKVMNMRSRKSLRPLATLALSAMLLLAAACGSQPAESADGTSTVRISQAFQSLLYLPLYVAQEKGYFEEQGVTVEIATGGGGTQSWTAVLGGSADFSIQDPVFVPKSHENGGPGVVVAAIQNAPSVFVIGREGGNAALDDPSVFEGKKVAVSPEPDTSWAFMQYLINERGLENVDLVNVALGSELAAVAGGQADLALSFEPTVSQAVVDQGLRVVYSFPANQDWYPFAFSSLTTTERFLQDSPDAAQAVVTAIAKASKFIYADPEATIDIAASYFPDLSREVVKAAVEREIEAKGYAEDITVTEKSWDNNMKVSLFTKNIEAYPSEATSYENNVNTELATKARDAIEAG